METGLCDVSRFPVKEVVCVYVYHVDHVNRSTIDRFPGKLRRCVLAAISIGAGFDPNIPIKALRSDRKGRISADELIVAVICSGCFSLCSNSCSLSFRIFAADRYIITASCNREHQCSANDQCNYFLHKLILRV